MSFFEQSLETAETTSAERAATLSAIAQMLVRTDHIEQASKIVDGIVDPGHFLNAERQVVSALVQKGKSGEAQAIVSKVKLQHPSVYAFMLAELIKCEANSGNVERAQKLLRDAGEEIQGGPKVSSLCALIVALDGRGDANVITLLDEAMSTVYALDNQWNKDFAFSDIAVAYCKIDKLTEALQVVNLISTSWRPVTLAKIAAELNAKDEQLAKRIFEEAIDLASRLEDDRLKHTAFTNIATIQARQGNRENLREVLKNQPKDWLGVESSILDTVLDSGDLDRVLVISSELTNAKATIIMTAFNGQLNEALCKLGPTSVASYVRELCSWTPVLDKCQSGLSFSCLNASLRIAGWFDPGWRTIYELLTHI
ncbi:MAG: tetratricopeptide repeat protein [Aggregatilineales bacterium]